MRAAIKRRNALRRKIKTHRREWLDACKEAREETIKAKEESWRNYLEDAALDPDAGKTWKVIRSLNGSYQANSPNEAMIHNGKLLTAPADKASAFIDHYANVSKIKFSREDRVFNRIFKKRLSGAEDVEAIVPFTIGELNKAIKKMKAKGAPGPDKIPPAFLKNLGPNARQKLLEIFNRSLSTCSLPQE